MTFNIGDTVCYTPSQLTCTIIAFYGADYKLQRHDTGQVFLSSRIVPGECGVSPPTEITCNDPTPHQSSGCDLLKWSDGNGDGVINTTNTASGQLARGEITQEEFDFIEKAVNAGSINALCPGCYTGTTPPPTFKVGDIVCYTPDQITCTIIALYGADYKLQRHDNGNIFLSSRIVLGACEGSQPPPNMETRTMALTEGQHTIQISLSGYDTLNATINVSSTGVTCTVGPCNTTGPPGVTTSGWTVTTYLKTASVTSDVCSWINSIGGWKNLQWTSHVLEAYYVYIGAVGHSVGFSPVTWDDVLGLYYYYINDPTAGNGKIGCGT